MSEKQNNFPKEKEIIKIKKRKHFYFMHNQMMAWMLHHLRQKEMPIPLTPLEIEDKNLALYVIVELKRIQLEAEALIDNINNKLKSGE